MRAPSRRGFLKAHCGAGLAAYAGPRAGAPPAIWCEEPQRRVFPQSLGEFKGQPRVELEACRGERVPVQLAFRSGKRCEGVAARLELRSPDVAWRTRAVGLVPCQELGMLTPDPLLDAGTLDLEAGQSRSLWLDIEVPPETKAGHYAGVIQVDAGRQRLASIPLALDVLDARLPEPLQTDFYLSIWQDPGAIARYRRVPLWSGEHWRLIEAYAADSARYGQKTITATVVEDPWASQTGYPFPSMVVWRYPGEWSLGGARRFSFDYTVFDRYVETYLRQGIRIVNCFSPSHWGAFAYYDEAAGKTRYRKYALGDPWYAEAWNQFLPDLIGHLKRRNWLAQAYLAMDEAPAETMEKVWPILRRYSSDLKIHLAGGGGRYGDEAEDLCYYYFDLQHNKAAFPRPDPEARRREGKRTTFYVCTGPTHPNTFLYSPAYGSRMLPWLVWKYGYDGFLRWALNSWPDRVWEQPRYRWGSGDMFLIYPGQSGPLDSMRWELLFAGIQDYQCLKAVGDRLCERERSGMRPDVLKQHRDEVAAAVALATGNEDPLITYNESHIARARRRVNRVLAKLVS